jgi:hypothetical protein
MDWMQALKDAGLPVVSAVDDPEVGISASFERELTSEEWQTYLMITNPAAAREAAAVTEAGLAVEFKALTPAQAVAYIENNVTDLASAKTAMQGLARLIVALRDQVWPDLQNL